MDTANNDVTAAALAHAETVTGSEGSDKITAPAPGSLEAELAALEAEQAKQDKANTEALDKGTTGTDTAAAGAKEAAKTAADAAANADPKDRAIIALRKENQTLKLKNAEVVGAARVLEHMVKAGVKTAGDDDGQGATDNAKTQVQTPTIESIDAEMLDLAQQLEDGKIDMPAYKRKELALMDQRADLRGGNATQTQQPVITDTTVQDHLAQLARDHPYVMKMTTDQLEPYRKQALQELELEGKLGTGNRADMDMRTRMAELVRKDHFRELGIEDPRKAQGQQQSTAKADGLSDAALAREKKLNAAGQHPADISKLGTGATGIPPSDAEALATMNSFGGDEDAAIRWLKAHPEYDR